MPQFHLNKSGRVASEAPPYAHKGIDFGSLDPFTQGYIEALFFTESSPAFMSDEWHSPECEAAQRDGQADGNIPGDVGFSDLAPEALASIVADCAAFQEANDASIQDAFNREYAYGLEQAGHDYWLTRNGHGARFWDRGLGLAGEKLTAAAEADGEVDVYFGTDNKVHV